MFSKSRPILCKNTLILNVFGISLQSINRKILIFIFSLMVCFSTMQSAHAACVIPNNITNGQAADASKVMDNFNALLSCVNNGSSSSLVLGFVLGNGSVGTNVGPILIASRSGFLSMCKVVIKSSDKSIPMSFHINKNGTNIFSSDPSVAPGSTSGTVLTFSNLTNSPLSVAADDLFTIDVTSGSPFWQITIQLE